MAKRNRHRKEQERLHEQEISKTPFQKMLDERAKRLEKIVRFQLFFFIISRETMLRHHAMSIRVNLSFHEKKIKFFD